MSSKNAWHKLCNEYGCEKRDVELCPMISPKRTWETLQHGCFAYTDDPDWMDKIAISLREYPGFLKARFKLRANVPGWRSDFEKQYRANLYPEGLPKGRI